MVLVICGYYISQNIALGYGKSNDVNDPSILKPISFRYHDNTYVLVYNGKLYNSADIKKQLIEKDFEFSGSSDTEILLKAYICYGYNVVNKLNGTFSFAIWDELKQELFLARDHFGIKPLYYSLIDDTLVFASEIKDVLKFPKMKAQLGREGLSELLGLGPAHTSGIGIFKNIYELKPAHYAVFNKSGLHLNRYWKLESKLHIDGFELTCDTISFLLEDSIERQLITDAPLGSMLSGGIDSSIITAYASKYLSQLNTLSVDYVDNDKYFVKNDFQPNSDNYYIDIISKKFNTNHEYIVFDTPELASSLKDAMIARDFPGMADIDSSLLLFCKKIKEKYDVVLSRGMF